MFPSLLNRPISKLYMYLMDTCLFKETPIIALTLCYTIAKIKAMKNCH